MPVMSVVDLVAVERRDERLVQELDRLVRDPVGLLLVALDRAAARLRAATDRRSSALQLDRRQRRELGVLVEEIEELSFPRQQAHGGVIRCGVGALSHASVASRRRHCDRRSALDAA